MTRVRRVGDRIEEILGLLRSGDAAAAAAAEELVGLLVGLYGDGLGHIVATLRDAGPAGAGLLAAIAEDPLVESLLLLHDLHPLDVDTRIQRALDRVRPYLGSHAGGVEYLGVTAGGVARLRLEGSCVGCPSSTVTVRLAIEDAVQNMPIFEENGPDKFKGVDIMRAVRSFDPCLPCGVHMYVGGGKTIKTVHSSMFGVGR